MATEKTLKARLLMKTDTSANWAKATNFVPKAGEIIIYSDDERKIKVGDGLTKVSSLKFVNQDELAKITTLGNELLAVKNGYVPNTRTINSKPLSANISLTASDVGAAASSHTHSYLPLSGGTVTGALTTNKELYSNAAIISKRNSNPQLILQNANGAQLGSIYSGTSDGSYSDVLISVNSSSSDVVYFGFAKNGQFTAPNNIYSKGTLVSQTNSYPGLTIQNASGANLAMLYYNGTNGGYSNAVLRVYSSASEYSSFSFGKDGVLDFGGVLRSGSHTIKGNSFPALFFTDLSVNKTFAYLQPQTSAGDYADVLLAVKNSSGQSNFLFAMDGDLTIGKKLYNPGGQVVKRLGLTSSGTKGYIKFATINLAGTTYQNQPIRIAIAQRGRYGSFKLRFASESSTDPTVEQFVKTGQIEVYIHKSATSTWDLYLKKSEAYDDIDVTVYENGSHNSFKFTWVDTLVSALPSGYITASEETWSGPAASANALNNTLAISKGGTGATTASGALTNLGALPLTGGTLTGALTAKALYASDGNVVGSHLVTQTNNYPEVYFKNTAGATLADLRVDTTTGSYAPVILRVHADASTSKDFTFGKDGTFSIPNSFSTVMGEFKSNAWPQLFFRNGNGNALARLVVPTDNGSYSGLAVNVFSNASTSVQYTFNSDGTFVAPAGIITTGNYVSIKNNSYPQLVFSNASGADLGKVFVSTTDGSYAATKIRAYSSASAYYDFEFSSKGTFTAKELQVTDGLAYLINYNSNTGVLGLKNINYGDFTEISCKDDGSLYVNNLLRATMLRVDGSNDLPSLDFKCKSKTNSGVLLQASSNHGFGIYCYGSDLDTATTRYYEEYKFPSPATGLTANKSYTVYSEKNIIYSSSQPAGVKGAIWLKPV